MKYFLIAYRLKNGTEEQRREEMERFIAGIAADPALRDKISYRCLKAKGGADYFHFVAAADDAAVGALQSQAFFKTYAEQTNKAAGGKADVTPLEMIAETAFRG